MIPAADLVDFLVRDLAGRQTRVGFYWYECHKGRQAVRDELRAATSLVCVVPLVLQRGFDNPNALSTDLVQLLDRERASIEDVVIAAARRNEQIGVVLIARNPLREPLIGSAVTMPDWFPYIGGRISYVDIVDVAGSATATFKSQQETVTDLQLSLFEIEGLVLARLERQRSADHNVTNAFFGRILLPNETPAVFLKGAAEEHGRQSAQGFRAITSPGSRQLIGRIVGKIGDLSPNQIPPMGDALFAALALAEPDTRSIPEPLIGILLRSTNKDFESNRARRCPRNVVLAIYCASQAVTAAAHSGEYGDFEVLALRSILHEVRTVLNAFRSAIG